MKSNIFFISILGLFLSLGCSSDTDTIESAPETTVNQGSFTIDGKTYQTTFAYASKEVNEQPNDIPVILSNKELLGEDIKNLSDVDFVYIDFAATSISEGIVEEILDYTIRTEAIFQDDIVQQGTKILCNSGPEADKYYATSKFLNIISFTSKTINFEFSFTRNDGKIIKGSYKGTYKDISS